jgi:hypothetical protein
MTVELLFTQSIRGDEYRSSFFTLQHGGRDAVGCLVPVVFAGRQKIGWCCANRRNER